jgi:hypothetical protein
MTRCIDVVETAPNCHLVVDWSMHTVVVPLLVRLGLFQSVADICQELGTLLHLLGNGRHPGVAWFI